MKSVGISFGIGALVSASFSKSFGTANKGISQLSNNIVGLNQVIINLKDSKSLLDKYIKDNKALKEKVIAIKETEKAIKNLKKEIEAEKKAIEENNGKTRKQRKALKESKKAVEEKTKSLKDLERKLDTLNQSYIKEAKNLNTTKNILKEKKVDLNDTTKAYEKLEKAIKGAEKATIKYNKATKMSNIANKISKGGTYMLSGAAAVAGTLYKPVQEAINAESNFSDVKKQFDFNSKEEEEKFKKDLHKIITEKKIAISLDELYGAAASAGQSGLNQKEAVEYIELASKIGMAFDMNREEAAQAMFEMKNALKLPYEGLIELTDKMNYLGNTTGASAAKITDFVNRTGNIGKLAGFSADKVAAIGASLIEQGMDADVAATGAKKVFSAMTKGNAVTKNQAKIYKSLGIDPVELSKLAQEDAQKALNLLFTKINSKSKDEQGAIMTLLFGEEGKRGAAAIAANLDRVNENLAKVNGDEAKGSVDKEADIKRATTANQLAIANGKLSIILSQLGTTVLPSVNSALEWFSNFLSKISAFQEKHPELFKKLMNGLVTGVAILGGLGIALKGVSIGFRTYSLYLKAAGFMTKHQVGTNILKSGAKLFNFGKRLIKGVGTLSKAFVKFGATMLASPITWVIAGIIALVAAGYLLYKNWDTVKQKAIELKNMVVGLIDKFWYLMGPIGWIVKGGMEIYRNWDKIKVKAAELKEKVANMITNLVLKWDNFKSSIKNILGNVFNWMEEKWNNLKEVGAAVADFFTGIFDSISSGIDKAIGFGKKLLFIGSDEKTAPPGRRGYSTQSNIKPYSYGGRNIPGYAKGGIVNSPTLAWVGEGATSESIIPHDSSERSFNLWEKTGRLIGAYEKTDNSSSFTFTYAPVINANDSKGVDEVIKKNQVDAFNEFKNMMKKYENEEKRRGRGR
nr:MAG TPA: minor tail protein [Caudoviricetes sp.]